MGLTLANAFRLTNRLERPAVAFVGAGGKTTAMFQTARSLQPPVFVTATTHLFAAQFSLADKHFVVSHPDSLAGEHIRDGVMLFTGEVGSDNRSKSISRETLDWLRETSARESIPLLIEADGSREKPLKAPKEGEPPIPEFANAVVLVAGLSAIGKPLTDEFVYRKELFAELSGLGIGDEISASAIATELKHPKGGRKNIPTNARGIVLLNQADSDETISQARGMVDALLEVFDTVIIASLHDEAVYTAHEQTAGIILAAGGSTRFGKPKQLLMWHGNPFVRSVVLTALEAGLKEVVVVSGANSEEVESSLEGLPIKIVRNERWQSGQASSIKAGIQSIPPETGSVIFMLTDQPQVGSAVIRSMIEAHAVDLAPIVAPLVLSDRRANPVLFDRITYPDLAALEGDVGGRAIFSKYAVEYLPWHDERILLDVDKPEDYERLLREDEG